MLMNPAHIARAKDNAEEDRQHANRPLSTGQDPHPETTGQPVDRGTGQTSTGSPRRGRSIFAGAGEALTDKEAVRIVIRQLSLEELRHEEAVIGKQLAILHGVLADIRRERKYRRELRG